MFQDQLDEPIHELEDNLQDVDDSWFDLAACKGHSAEAGSYEDFFSPEPEVQLATKKRFCQRCPVTGECYDFAIRQRLDEGIFGGMTPDERKRMRFWMSGIYTKRSRLVQFEVDD